MPQIIDIPGQGQVEFPDGMSDEQIVSAIRQLTAGPTPKTPKAADKPGMLDAIGRGVARGGWALPGLVGLDYPKAEGVLAGARSLLSGGEYGKAAAEREAGIRRGNAAAEANYPITTGLAVGAGAVPSMAVGGQAVPLLRAIPAAEALAVRTGVPLLVRNAPLIGRAAAGSANAAGGGLVVGTGSSNSTDPAERVKEGLVGAAGGATLGWLAPTWTGSLTERAALQATNDLERKVAEKGLQAISGGRGNAKRLSRVLAQEDPNRPVQVGLEAFRSSEMPARFQTPDEIAAALAAAEKQAGANVGEVYGQATTPAIPKAQIVSTVEQPARALNSMEATKGASEAALDYLRGAVEKARLRTVRREIGSNPSAPWPEGKLAPADVQALRMDLDTQARGWKGSVRPQDTAAADAINQARGALNQKLLQPAMERIGLGPEARAADARFGRVADAAKIAKANDTGGLYGSEDAMSQLERVLSPAGSLLAQTGEALGGRPGQATMGILSTVNKATLNNPRWIQRQGRGLYSGLVKAYGGSPPAPPGRAPVLSPWAQAMVEAILGKGKLGMAVPVPADDQAAK